MKWLDEIMSKKSWTKDEHVLSDIGILTVVHDTFNNNCEISRAQGFALFGSDWEQRVERLRASGVLHVERTGHSYKLRVKSRSDQRRKQVAEAQKKFRQASLDFTPTKETNK